VNSADRRALRAGAMCDFPVNEMWHDDAMQLPAGLQGRQGK